MVKVHGRDAAAAAGANDDDDYVYGCVVYRVFIVHIITYDENDIAL